MNRRTVLTALGAGPLALAGCVAEEGTPTDGPSPGSGPGGATLGAEGVRGYFESGPTRPECHVESERVEVEEGDETRTDETAATIPYPDPPEAYTGDAAVEYLVAFEEAYVTHDVLCDRRGRSRVLDVGFHVRTTETFDWYDDVETVFMHRAGAATRGVGPDGAVWVTDLAHEGVVFSIDGTGVARAEYDGAHSQDPDEYEENAPDPLEAGDLVAAFD